MSHRLLARSPDLRRLVEEGYEVEVRGGYLVVGHVPYVDTERNAQFGELVFELTLAGDVTTKPSDHVARFAGSTPCDAVGHPLTKIINGSGHQDMARDVSIDHTFSAKPTAPEGYSDYHHKVTTYVAMLSGHAEQIDPEATARTYRVIEQADDDSPFLYLDTATPRAGLDAIAERLKLSRVAIVGTGGTGTYILDLVAKTPVREIHLYDGDRFLQHNPFRSPGATSTDDLHGGPNKANYWASVYSRMRKNVVPHPEMVDNSNIDELFSMDFVFVAIDRGSSRRVIVTALEERGVPFIDIGMGIYEADGLLAGAARVSVGTLGRPTDKARIPFSDGDADNEYSHNIQIADLNALNAALAVIKWKKICGFYADLEQEHFSAYTIAGNRLINEDRG
jgi:ThiF family